ncbi:hypothetical protein KEM52_004509 [Ascosphaera acerosa]|nr:hypothetical protein KEM52_004509 [Ascosphaera acerosa]
MHSVASRAQAVFGCFTSVGMLLGLLLALSTAFFPADVASSVELTDIKVSKGRPTYYAQRREEYAQIRFDLDADISSLFNWNTKQVFLYVYASYPSTVSPNATSEVVIWDYIVPAPPSPYSLTALKEQLQALTQSKSIASKQKKRTTASSRSRTKSKSKSKPTTPPRRHGLICLRNQRPKYHLTDITRALARRENATLHVGWNVQPWVGPLQWSARSSAARNVGEARVLGLGWATAGPGGASSAPFAFPEVPVPEHKRRREAAARAEAAAEEEADTPAAAESADDVRRSDGESGSGGGHAEAQATGETASVATEQQPTVSPPSAAAAAGAEPDLEVGLGLETES